MKYNFAFSKTEKIKSNTQGLYVPGSNFQEFEKPSVEIPFSCKGSIIMRHGRGTKMKVQIEGAQKRRFKFGFSKNEAALEKIPPREFLALKCAIIAMLEDTYNNTNFGYSRFKAETVLKKFPAGFLRDADIKFEYMLLMARLVKSKSSEVVDKRKVDKVKVKTGEYQNKLKTKYLEPREQSLEKLGAAQSEIKSYSYEDYLKEQEALRAMKNGMYGMDENKVNEEYSSEKTSEQTSTAQNNEMNK